MDNLFYKIPIVRSALRNWDFFIFKRNWRKQNKHNSTVAMNCFPLDCVKVGEATYGELHVLSYQPEQEFFIYWLLRVNSAKCTLYIKR